MAGGRVAGLEKITAIEDSPIGVGGGAYHNLWFIVLVVV
jgi:hypothetical protein